MLPLAAINRLLVSAGAEHRLVALNAGGNDGLVMLLTITEIAGLINATGEDILIP